MQSSFLRRTLPKLIFALVALTVGVFLSRADSVFAVGSYTASTFVNLNSVATGANADTTFSLSIPAPDYNFSAVINSIPKGSTANIACGPNYSGPAGDCFAGGAAKGDVVGKLHSDTKLGLLNGACNGDVGVDFVFLNATVDVGDTIDPIPQAATNTGQGGTLSNQWSDDGSGAGQDPPWNAAWPGMDAGESTNGLPAQVDEYPSYINTIFTPDAGPSAGIPTKPVARYAGAANVAGSAIMLNLVIFGPDVLANAFPAPNPFHDTRGLGYTSIAILNNPVAEAAPSDITDFCTTLSTTTVSYGVGRINPCNGTNAPPCNTPTGISLPCTVFPGDTCTGLPTTGVGRPTALNRYANPSVAGTYAWVSLHQSLRDKDGDGKENSLDTCASNVDALDQRVGPPQAADSDSDGIPEVGGLCDTVSNTGVTDQDGDGWRNRGDNCPTVLNADNLESENPPTLYSAAAPKGGPRTDGIGDVCDANPTVADGVFLSTLTYDAHCIGGVDGDGDGYCVADDPNDANPLITPETSTRVFTMWMVNWGSGAAPPEGQPIQACNDGVDNDGDGSTDTADSGCTAVDTDGDGFSFAIESHVGTNPLRPCDPGGAPTEPNAFWPGDLAGTAGAGANKINLQDVTSYTTPVATRKFGTNPGDPNYNVRWDISPSNPQLNLADITTLTAGGNGSPAKPPFYETAGVFNKAFGNATFCHGIFKP